MIFNVTNIVICVLFLTMQNIAYQWIKIMLSCLRMSLFSILPKGTRISYEKVLYFALFCCFTNIQGIKKSLKTYSFSGICLKLRYFKVRMKGLEPPRLSAPDPKSGVATNYTTSAAYCVSGYKDIINCFSNNTKTKKNNSI